MAAVILVEASPLDPASRATSAVRLAGGGRRAYSHDGHEDWLGGLTGRPRFSTSLGFDSNGWAGGAVPTTGNVVWASADRTAQSRLAGLFWVDQQVTIKVGDDAAADPVFTTVMAAKVAKQEVVGGQLQLTIADLSGDLVKPIIVATARFAGTGGIEGDASVAGRAKRRSWGRVYNVEGRVLIAADNVYEFGDPARPLHGMPVLRDKGRDAPAGDIAVVAWAGSIDATLAALRAATPTRGGGVIAPSIACAKWWTQPSGPFTADLLGEGGDDYTETPAGIARLIVLTASQLSIADVEAAIALRPAPAGIHADDVSETAASLLDRLLAGVSLLWLVDAAGGVVIREWSWPSGEAVRWAAGSVAVTWLAGDAVPVAWAQSGSGITLQSLSVSRKDVLRPITSRRLGYRRNHRQHTSAEISAAVLADDVIYPDGTSAAALQPAEGGADVTSANQHSLTTPAPMVLTADYLGNVIAGQLPIARSFRRLLGATDVSADASWTVSVPAGLAATIDDTAGDQQRGTVSVTAVDLTSATLTIKSSYAGIDLYGSLAVTRVYGSTDQETGSVGAGGSASGAATVAPSSSPGTSSTLVAIAPELTVTVGASGKVTLAFQLSYGAVSGVAGDDDTTMVAQFAQAGTGGSWSAVGSEASGSPAATYFNEDYPKGWVYNSGSVSTAFTLTGLAAGAATFRLEARVDQGYGISAVSGSISATPI